MKSFLFFLLTLIILSVMVYFSNSQYVEAVLHTIKSFFWFFNLMAVCSILPILGGGKRYLVNFYNQFAGMHTFWSIVEGLCWAYMVVWILYMLPIMDVLTGFNHFNHYDWNTGRVVYNLPFIGEFALAGHSWDLWFIIGFAGILGVKAAWLFQGWAGTLKDESLQMDERGTIWTNKFV
jgi:hypothetical protein